MAVSVEEPSHQDNYIHINIWELHTLLVAEFVFFLDISGGCYNSFFNAVIINIIFFVPQ